MVYPKLAQIERILRSRLEVPGVTPPASVRILASYPKSGNTWLRFISSKVLADITKSVVEVDFHSIENFAPVIRGNRKLNGAVFSPSAPTFLKTHFYYGKRFRSFNSVLLYRDPFKTLVSHYKYMSTEGGASYDGFDDFLGSSRVGLRPWLMFYDTWLRSGAICVRYEDLVADPVLALEVLFKKTGFSIPLQILKDAVQYCSRENMQRLEHEKGDPNKRDPNFKFVALDEDRYKADDFARYHSVIVDETYSIRKKLDERNIFS